MIDTKSENYAKLCDIVVEAYRNSNVGMGVEYVDDECCVFMLLNMVHDGEKVTLFLTPEQVVELANEVEGALRESIQEIMPVLCEVKKEMGASYE